MKKTRINGYAQNVFVREQIEDTRVLNDCCQETYLDLERVQTSNGISERVVEREYPITAESVASYADGCDYRLNLENAVNQKPTSPNLGDTSVLSDVLSRNPRDVAVLFEKLQKIMAEKAKKKEEPLKSEEVKENG